jgi:hypothetical protein
VTAAQDGTFAVSVNAPAVSGFGATEEMEGDAYLMLTLAKPVAGGSATEVAQ